MAKKRGKKLPDGYSTHTISFNPRATQIIRNRQADLILKGKKRSVEQIVNGIISEQIV